MQELAVSMMKFSAAMTMFGIQQVQNAVEVFTDSQKASDKFRHALDTVTKALTSEMDQSNKSATTSMSELGEKLVDRAVDAIDIPALDPRKVIKAATDVLKKTTDSMTEMVDKVAEVAETAKAEVGAAVKASEPKSAAEALATKK